MNITGPPNWIEYVAQNQARQLSESSCKKIYSKGGGVGGGQWSLKTVFQDFPVLFGLKFPVFPGWFSFFPGLFLWKTLAQNMAGNISKT